MELSEMIKIMQHYENCGEVEFKQKREDDTKWRLSTPSWNWDTFEYRIKEQKQKVTIEKWLLKYDDGEYRIVQTSNVDKFLANKIKLIESYEVEL